MSMFGEFDDIFGSFHRQMRQMDNMMNSMFAPFGMGGGFPSITNGFGGMGNQLMPFGGINMDINRMMNPPINGNCQSFTSSSVVKMTHGPDGKPVVYKESATSRTGPGGVRETQRTVQDSRTGIKKMAIGHHLGDKAHIIERERNLLNGEEEEREDFINLDEDEAEEFTRKFQMAKKSTLNPAIQGSSSPVNNQLAITAGPTPTVNDHSYKNRTSKKHSIESPASSPKRSLNNSSSSARNQPYSNASKSTSQNSSRTHHHGKTHASGKVKSASGSNHL